MPIGKKNDPIPKNVKAILRARQLKQKDIAVEAGFTPQQFSDMMHGRKIIRPCDVLAIAKVLDVEMWDLFQRRTGDREMTLKEIQEYDRAWLTCAQIAPVLGADPYAIHLQAHANPEKLGFPVIVAGRRVKIPRIPFLKFLCGE